MERPGQGEAAGEGGMEVGGEVTLEMGHADHPLVVGGDHGRALQPSVDIGDAAQQAERGAERSLSEQLRPPIALGPHHLEDIRRSDGLGQRPGHPEAGRGDQEV